MRKRFTKEPEIKAASVHLLTALGSVCALLAVNAAIGQATELAFFWLGVAFFIDGIDGYFARRFEVKIVLPHVSGETLDLCVDYVTYVFVPALILQQHGPLHGVWGKVLTGVICLTALYHFADTGSKAEDNSFVGFPAIWNIVAFYVFALNLSDWAASALILTCVALTFVPLKWVHPMRVVSLRPVTVGLTVLWAVVAVLITWNGFPAGWLLSTVIVGVALYGFGLSFYLGRAR